MGWEQEQKILRDLSALQSDFNFIKRQFTIVAQLASTFSEKLPTIENELNLKLDRILRALVPPQATGFKVLITTQGARTKALADIEILDTGTFTTELVFLDSQGEETLTPAGLNVTYIPSDLNPSPSIFNQFPTPDGVSCDFTINKNAIKTKYSQGLPQGLTVNVTATWNGLEAPVTVTTSPAIDVVAGPAVELKTVII